MGWHWPVVSWLIGGLWRRFDLTLSDPEELTDLEISARYQIGAISDREAAAILGAIAEEDLNGRIRGNILDTQRTINFLIRSQTLTSAQLDDGTQILRNIDSLNSHTSLLLDKINFLMDPTTGFININQNKRITQLPRRHQSVARALDVCFM